MPITPAEYPKSGVFGYWVRNSRTDPPFSEWFSYKKYGGKTEAERAARKKDAEIEKLARPANSSHKDVITKSNKSGKVGVDEVIKKDTKNPDNEYLVYLARWFDESGHRKTSQWSAEMYGKTLARKCATFARDNKTTDRAHILRQCDSARRFD